MKVDKNFFFIDVEGVRVRFWNFWPWMLFLFFCNFLAYFVADELSRALAVNLFDHCDLRGHSDSYIWLLRACYLGEASPFYLDLFVLWPLALILLDSWLIRKLERRLPLYKAVVRPRMWLQGKTFLWPFLGGILLMHFWYLTTFSEDLLEPGAEFTGGYLTFQALLWALVSIFKCYAQKNAENYQKKFRSP